MSATATTTTSATDPQPTPPATEPDAPGTEPAADEQPRFTQAQVNAMLADEKRRAKERADRERQRAEEEARARALAEQGEFKTLAEQRADRIVELEARVAEIDALTGERDGALAVVAELVRDELADAPDFVADAIAERSPVEQLAYIRKHRDKWAKNAPRRGIDAPPRPARDADTQLEQREQVAVAHAQRLKSVF